MPNEQESLDRLKFHAFYASELPSLKTNSSSGRGQALCPFHKDTKPSLSVNLQTGQFRCFGCGRKGSAFNFYMAKHNVDFQTAKQALAKEAGLISEPQKIVKAYDYTDEAGELVFQTVRYDPKDFKQRRPDGKGRWIWSLQGVRLVLYNLPEVLKAESILIVEGEKDADNLNALGLTATCNPMGAGKWKPEYNQYFKGKRVAIIPDNDEQGKRHAETVAGNLKGVAESVKVVELPDLPDKGDVSDWLSNGNNKDRLLELIREAPEWEVSKCPDIGGRQLDTSEINLLSFLKRGSDLQTLECSIEWAVDRLLPKQSITLLHGKGGIGKTWVSLIMADVISRGSKFMGLDTQKMPVVFVDFENSLPVLVDRIRKIGIEDVLFWHNANETLRPPKLDRQEWTLYKNLPPGSLLIFDTLRASQGQDENDSQKMNFIMSRLKELRDMGFTILLLHHTPKSNERIYKGSTAIIDLADHVLSLHKVRKGNFETEADDDEDTDCYYRLGTKDKTRYEPFHIFMAFDPEKGFIKAPDPDEETMKQIHGLIVELKESAGEPPIQSRIIKKAKEELDLSDSKVRKLLKKGDGKYWHSDRIPERKNAVVYDPISVCQFDTPIYRKKTERLTETDSQFVNNNPSENVAKTPDNTEFDSFSGGVCQTEKQDKCALCDRLEGCMLTKGQRQLCEGPYS